MEHTARISKRTGSFHIDLEDSENRIYMWIIINSDERVDILTIWTTVTMELVGSLSINFGDYPGLPFTY